MSIELMQLLVVGTPISTANIVENEVPTGTKNSINKDFTLAYTPETGTIKLYLRGQRLEEDNATDGFSRSGITITLGSSVTAPAGGADGTNDPFLVDYRKA